MSTSVAQSAPVSDPTGPATARTPASDADHPVGGVIPVTDTPNLRLVIEEDRSSGSYIYKTVDVRTGNVVQQVPREEVLRLREAAGYQPGAVIDARG